MKDHQRTSRDPPFSPLSLPASTYFTSFPRPPIFPRLFSNRNGLFPLSSPIAFQTWSLEYPLPSPAQSPRSALLTILFLLHFQSPANPTPAIPLPLTHPTPFRPHPPLAPAFPLFSLFTRRPPAPPPSHHLLASPYS